MERCVGDKAQDPRYPHRREQGFSQRCGIVVVARAPVATRSGAIGQQAPSTVSPPGRGVSLKVERFVCQHADDQGSCRGHGAFDAAVHGVDGRAELGPDHRRKDRVVDDTTP